MFAFRADYHRSYWLLTFVSAYYFQMAGTIKIIYDVLISLHVVKKYLEDHQNERFVCILNVIFGQEEIINRSGNNMALVYHVSMVCVVMLAHLWKQCKWVEIREVLEKKDMANAGFTEQYRTYFFEKEQ